MLTRLEVATSSHLGVVESSLLWAVPLLVMGVFLAGGVEGVRRDDHVVAVELLVGLVVAEVARVRGLNIGAFTVKNIKIKKILTS